MANIPSILMDNDLCYFDAKIVEYNKYLDALKKAAEEEELPRLKNWFASVIDHMTDMREVLIYCKAKLQSTAERTKSSVSPDAPLFPINLKSQVTPLSPPASNVLPSGIQTSAANVRSNGATPSTTFAVNDEVLAARAIENQESIVFINVPESALFHPKDKLNSDRVDIQTILELLGVAANVQSTCRFSPKALPSDRPPFLKARFSSEEEKKIVLDAVKSNIKIIHSMGAKFGEITVCDPDKSGAGTNSYRDNANSAGASFSSNCQNASPPVSTASMSLPPRLPLNDCAVLPTTSPSTSSSHVRSNGFGSSTSNLCAISSSIKYPSSFGNCERFSSNLGINLLGTNRTPQPSNAPAAVLQPSTVDEDDEVVMDGFPSDKTPEIMKTWNHPKIQKTILENIANEKYVQPRKMQSYAIPLALNGYDLAVQAESGSGKTSAYLIPIVARCIRDKTNQEFSSKPFFPYAIIITPSRELAQQGYEQALKFVQDTEVTVARAYGEFSIDRNKEELAKGCDVIFVTPGRLADFVARHFIMLNTVHFVVFDESDRLLSGDFKRTIDRALFGSSSKMPHEHQTLFYSATFDTYCLAESNQYMRRKKKIVLKNKVTVPSRKCDQEFVIIGKTGVFGAIITYLRSEFAKVQETHGKIPPTLIFCRRQIDCIKVAMGLEMKEIPAKSISGLLAQDLREKALCEFRDGTSILCVTDLFSRGLDLKDVDVVINFEMPQKYETYIHRVGRAGRIRRGKCISFVEPDEDAYILSRIKKAMEEAGHVIPQSLIDAVDVYKPPEKAAVGFNLMTDDYKFNGPLENVSDAKKEEKPEAVV